MSAERAVVRGAVDLCVVLQEFAIKIWRVLLGNLTYTDDALSTHFSLIVVSLVQVLRAWCALLVGFGADPRW